MKNLKKDGKISPEFYDEIVGIEIDDKEILSNPEDSLEFEENPVGFIALYLALSCIVLHLENHWYHSIFDTSILKVPNSRNFQKNQNFS